MVKKEFSFFLAKRIFILLHVSKCERNTNEISFALIGHDMDGTIKRKVKQEEETSTERGDLCVLWGKLKNCFWVL